MIYIDLILNLSLLVALTIVSGFIDLRWPQATRRGVWMQGLLFGGVAILGMLRPLNLGQGLIFDGRSVMLSLCALFFGPWAAGISTAMVIACRLWLGGVGMVMGVSVALAAAGIGLFARIRLQPTLTTLKARDLYLFGLAVHVAMVALMMTLPKDMYLGVMLRIAPPVLLLYPLATILAGKLLSDQLANSRTLDALKESNQQLRTLSNNLPGGLVYQIDSGVDGQQRRFSYISEGVQRLHGVSVAEAMADAALVYQQVLEADRALVAQRELQALKTMTPFAAEVQIRTPAGEMKWSRFTSAPRRLPNQHIVWDGIETDITKRKTVERDLAIVTTVLEQAFEQSPIPMVLVSMPDAILRIVNPACRELLGMQAEPSVIGTSLMDFQPPFQDYDLAGNLGSVKDLPLARALQGQKTIDEERKIVRKDGSVRFILVNGVPIFNRQREIIAGYLIMSDITARKQEEAEREKLRGQLLQAQKMESVGRLAGGVAHDFNNMLQTILGNVELALEKANATHAVHAELKEIQRAAEHSANLTRQLLAFARKQTVAPKKLNLSEALAGMLQMMRRLIGENIELVWRPSAAVWPVKMDPSQLEQILANLCVNARDAIAGAGRLVVTTGNVTFDAAYCAGHPGAVPGRYGMLSVSDNGSGMSKEILARLFEPYFTTKGLGEGTGLGLAMIYGIVKQNNGYITVQSEPGQGSIFTICLPACMEEAAAAPAQDAAAAEPVEAEAKALPQTVLLVEDEPSILNLARAMLELKNYFVLSAGTAEEALALARQYPGEIHLLITDVVMPGLNGRELARQLQAIRPGLKCLYTSGYTADIIAHQGVLDQGMHFIQKPFSIQSLAAKIRETLQEEPPPTPPA